MINHLRTLLLNLPVSQETNEEYISPSFVPISLNPGQAAVNSAVFFHGFSRDYMNFIATSLFRIALNSEFSPYLLAQDPRVLLNDPKLSTILYSVQLNNISGAPMIASGYAVGNPTSGIFNHTWTVGYASSGSIFVRNIDTNVTATLPVSFNGDASIPVMLDPGQKVFIQFTGITSVPASLNTVVTASAPISYDYIALSSRLQNGNVVSLLSLITDADLKANIQHALLDHTHPERVISAALTLYSYSFNV